jgi:hypothetical protein
MMARQRKETLLDRINKVRHAQMKIELGMGLTPDEAGEALAIAAQAIEDLLHRRYLASAALDLAKDIAINSEIVEQGSEQ